MSYTHEESWACLEEVFNAKLGINEAWNKIIDYHEQLKPKKYWAELRKLEVQKEQDEIAEWIDQVVLGAPLPDSVKALWIGITNIWDEETNKEYYAVFIQGADSYDAEDIEWTSAPSYDPDDNFGIMDSLNQITDIIKTDSDDFSFLDWILPIAYCVLTMDEIIRKKKLDRSLFLKNRDKLFVSAGFDDGDYMNLTAIE